MALDLPWYRPKAYPVPPVTDEQVTSPGRLFAPFIDVGSIPWFRRQFVEELPSPDIPSIRRGIFILAPFPIFSVTTTIGVGATVVLNAQQLAAGRYRR